MFLLFISYVKAQFANDSSCLFLPIVAAVTHLCTVDPSFPHGRTGEDSDGRLLLLVAEAMLGVFSGGVSRAIYRSTYVGIVCRFLILETSIFFDEHLQNQRKH